MIIFSTVLIVSLSFITLASIQVSLLATQAIALAIGVIIAFLIYKSDLIVIYSLSWGFYIFSILLLLAVLFFGADIRGSTRWFNLGILSFQPSEVAKPLLAIFFAAFLRSTPPKNLKNILIYLGLVFIPTLLVLLEPDLGSSLVIVFLGASLIFLANVSYKFLGLGIMAAGLIIIPAYTFLAPYQKTRIASFVNPYVDPKGSGYNIIQSTIAIGSGGFLGQGIKQGTQSQLKFLPERHTDFIFASFVEEFGLLGATILFFLFFLFFFKFYSMFFLLKNAFSRLLLAGIILVFVFEVGVNLSVNLGLLPVTGIALPLFSYGGSSLIAHISLLGLVLLLDKNKTGLYP